MAKIRLFYSGAMALILPQLNDIAHFVFYDCILGGKDSPYVISHENVYHETTTSGGSENAFKKMVEIQFHEKMTLLILLFGSLCVDCTRVKNISG